MNASPVSLSTSEPLPGTVKPYRRHLIVCTGQADWPAHLETASDLVGELARAIAAQGETLPAPVKVTACDAVSTGPGCDILVFPDNLRYRGVTTADVPALIAGQVLAGQPASGIRHEPLDGVHVFICTHGARDQRCGACGPPLYERFAAEIAARGLEGRVHLYRSSHVGGHRYAGNVLIYPVGDWYGYVTPAAVPVLIERAILEGGIVPELWRGRMGMAPEAQIAFLATRFPAAFS
jgi:hypothetical protein